MAVPLVMSIALIASAYVAGNATSQSTGVMQLIQDNFETALIADVKTVNNGAGCPAGYAAIGLGQWPGTNTGCYANGLFTAASVRSGSCSKGNKRNTIPAVGAIDLTNFDNTVFCAQYLQPKADYVYTNNCPAGYAVCGPYLCVKNTLTCPIIGATYSANQPNGLTADQTAVALNGNNGYVTLTRGNSATPLLDFYVEFNGAPCLSQTQHPVRAGGVYYPPLDNKPQGCGTYGTFTAANLLTTENEANFDTQNGVPVDTVLKMYGYYLQGGLAELYARPRLALQPNDFCYQIDPVAIDKATDGIADAVLAAQISGFVLLLSGFIIIVWSLSVNLPKFSLEECAKKLTLPFGGALVVVVIENIITTAIVGSYTKQLTNQVTYLQTVASKNCFVNQEVNQAANDFLSTPGKTLGLYYESIATLVINFLPVIPIFWAIILNRRR